MVCFGGGQDKKSGALTPNIAALKCTIALDDSNLHSGGENNLRVAMRNLQATDTTIDTFNVYLSPSGYPAPLGDEPAERAYVAPINLETKGALEPKQTRDDEWHYPSTLLKIVAGGEEAFAVDLSSLRWGRVNAAQLPSQKLGSVEPGKYTIYVVATRDGISHKCVSNRMAVALHK